MATQVHSALWKLDTVPTTVPAQANPIEPPMPNATPLIPGSDPGLSSGACTTLSALTAVSSTPVQVNPVDRGDQTATGAERRTGEEEVGRHCRERVPAKLLVDGVDRWDQHGGVEPNCDPRYDQRRHHEDDLAPGHCTGALTGGRFGEPRLAHDDRPLAQCRRRNAVKLSASYSVLGSQTCGLAVVPTLIRVHDDPYLDDELADESGEDDAAIVDENAHTLSIRLATGEEVLTVFSPSEEWSAYLQPGGGMTSAFLGTPSDPIVWVNATDRRVERDEDGAYVIRID